MCPFWGIKRCPDQGTKTCPDQGTKTCPGVSKRCPDRGIKRCPPRTTQPGHLWFPVRTTLIFGAEIRLAFAQQSRCSKNCMQKLIEGSSSSTNARGGGNGRRRSSSSSASAALSHYDEDSSFDNSSFLFCQQIGIPTPNIPTFEFDKFVEEVRRPLFEFKAGTSSDEEASNQLRYYLVQKFTEYRIGDPDNKQNFLYLYQLHSLSRGTTIVCKTTCIVITF